MFKDEWEKQTGGTIDIVEIPFGDLYQRLFAAFTSGADQFDIAIYASNWIPEFAQAGHVIPLEPYYSQKENWNDVLPTVQRIMYSQGKRYTVPLDGDIIIGYYRKDALENAEYQKRFHEKYGYDLTSPATWAQYRDIAEFFTGWDWAASGKPGFGVLEAQKPKDVGAYILNARAATYAANPTIKGSFFFDPDTMEPQVGNPGWVQALKDWTEIRKFGPPEMATYGGGEMRGNFIAGDYALGIDWADVGIMAQDENSSVIKGKIGYFVLPGPTKVWNLKSNSWQDLGKPNSAPFQGWGGWHGSVVKTSKVPDAAWSFLDFIDSTPNALKAVTTPGTARNPYRADHFANPQAWANSPVKYADPKPYLSTIEAALSDPNAQSDLRIPQSGRYYEVLDQWIQEALAGSLTPEAAMKKVADQWASITKDAGVDNQRKLYRDLYGLT